MLKAAVICILTMLLAGVVTPAFSIQVDHIPETYDAQTSHQLNDTAENMTLAQTIQLISENVDWDKAIYAGVLFNKRAKADLEALIDGYAANGSWLDVLKWTVICQKLGIEREEAIKAALDGLPMVGPLPWTITYGGVSYFCVEHKFALFGYYYAEKYNYRLDKWNKTNAYNYFRTVINNKGKPVLFVGDGGKTWTIVYGPRYYDESASTVQCFLVFYELGVSEALNDALYWWSWINDNLWYQDTHYKYALNSADYECEAGFFAKIIANLKTYYNDLQYWSRVLTDMQNRFLIDKWNSKQWGGEKTTHVVIHHYSSNFQRRLQNTIGAWTSMLTLYEAFTDVSQNAMRELLTGYDELEPAWKLLLSQTASLYDESTQMFRWESTSALSHEATAYALALMFLMGITPKTTTLAFPLEEYTYEYIYDIDPELYSVNLANNTIRISVMKEGTLEFAYGTQVLPCNFPSNGTYEIVFTSDWNNIFKVLKLHDLPPNRKYFRYTEPPKHDIAILDITLPKYTLYNKETVEVFVTVLNSGDYNESVNITLFANTTIIDTLANINLASGNIDTITFTWNTTGLTKGTYTISAYAWPVANETDIEDNYRTANSTVTILNLGHDVAVKGITSKNSVGRGYPLTLNVMVMNVGSYIEVFNVTIAINASNIESQEAALDSGASVILTFTLNTTDLVFGNYTISVSASPVQEEDDITDNTLNEWIVITIPGDINGDFCVEGKDIALVAKAYDSSPSSVNWIANADINNDGKVEGKDVALIAKHYGQSYP